MIATRAADYQCVSCLREPGRRQRRPHLRRRRLRQPERQVDARGAALADRASRRSRSTSTAPLGCGRENTTWRNDAEEYLADHTPSVPWSMCRRSSLQHRAARRAHATRCRPTAPSSCPDASARGLAARRFCEDILDALALGVGDYFEKNRAFRKIGVALSGGRDSLLTLLIAHRCASRGAAGRTRAPCSGPSTCPSRYSSDADARRRPRRSPRDLGVPLRGGVDRRGLRARAGRGASDARRRRGGDRADEAEHPGAHPRPADVELGNTSGGLFLQTGNMSEKARRLHDHRGRPGGRARRHRQRAQDAS